MMVHKLLGIIPARLGSKGIPNKNARLLGKKPLLAYTIDTANEAGIFDRLIISTDSEKIANIGRQLGVDVPFIRPKYLSKDDTPMLPVIQHALKYFIKKDWHPDVVCILQPTAPFRRTKDLIAAYQLICETACDSVVSVESVPSHYSPQFVMRIINGQLKFFLPEGELVTRRQDSEKAYSRNGHFYFTQCKVLMEQNSIYGEDCRPIIVSRKDSINLDTMEDWHKASEIVNKRGYY